MKFGGSNPLVRAGVVALFVASLGWFAYTMWNMAGGDSQPAATAAPRPSQATPAKPAAQAGSLITLEKRLDPTLRFDLLKASEETEYAGKGRNIFQPFTPPPEIPDVETPPIVPEENNTAVNTPPPPPPIDLKFYGFASRPGEPKKIFLAQGENIFIGGEGDIVNRRYRIVKIGATSVEIEDVLNNQRQSIPLTS